MSYNTRSSDESFKSVSALVDSATSDQAHSVERTYNLKDLSAVADGPLVRLASPKGTASFSHWAFGQLARMIGAPAGYLRSLPATIAADCVNSGLKTSDHGATATLLVQAPNGNPEPLIRACTSESYARVWDGPLYAEVQRQIIDRDPTWEVTIATRGDRDSFLTLTNKRHALQDPSVQNIVNDPQAAVGGIMYRSITIHNSEVGAAALTLDGGVYRARCKNLMLWSFTSEKAFRRRHVGTKVLRDAMREISAFAFKYAEQSTERDQAIINSLITHEIAFTKEAVIDELRSIGASKDQAESAYASCEQNEPASPRSFWGVAQGLTRISQESGFSDDRFILDQLAAKVLARGAQLVHA